MNMISLKIFLLALSTLFTISNSHSSFLKRQNHQSQRFNSTKLKISNETIPGLVELEISGFENEFEKNNGFYEYKDKKSIPPSVLNLFGQVNFILNKIAINAFNKNNYSEVFNQGYVLGIEANQIGPLNSYEGVLTVFPNWTPEEGILRDKKSCIIAHEVGHEIAAFPSHFGLPESLSILDRFGTFSEFYADWISYKACGDNNIYQFQGLPPFALRDLSLTNFEISQYRFEYEEIQKMLYKWVLKILQNSEEHIRSNYVLQNLDIARDDAEEVKTMLKDLNERKVTTSAMSLNMHASNIDEHRLSVPLLVLFKQIEKKLKRSVSVDFLEALKLIGTKHERYGHKIVLNHLEDKKIVFVPTPFHFVQAFINQLTSKIERRKVLKIIKKQNIMKGLKNEFKQALDEGILADMAVLIEHNQIE